MSDAGLMTYRSPGTQVAAKSMEACAPLLEVRDLQTWFPIRGGILARTVGHVKAVDGVSFEIQPGKTLGLVGESGCGKTTVGRTILRLIGATGGSVRYKGEDFFAFEGKQLRQVRRQMQIVFQDPVSSLNPRMTIGNIIGEPIEVHGIAKGRARNELVASLLSRVGLDPTYATRYPHEFSGGQRQRIGIARALALSPDFIVCDEPVSALDVSIRAQILDLFADLNQRLGIAYLFITHDLTVARAITDDVMVMHEGRIVERGKTGDILDHPQSEAARALVAAAPDLHRAIARRLEIPE